MTPRILLARHAEPPRLRALERDLVARLAQMLGRIGASLGGARIPLRPDALTRVASTPGGDLPGRVVALVHGGAVEGRVLFRIVAGTSESRGGKLPRGAQASRSASLFVRPALGPVCLLALAAAGSAAQIAGASPWLAGSTVLLPLTTALALHRA